MTDKLLKETAAKHFAKEHFVAYDNLPAFESQLKLDSTEQDQLYVNNLIHAAPQVFYTEDNPDCVYRRCHVLQQIRKEHQDSLDTYPWFAQQLYNAQQTQQTGMPPQSTLDMGDIMNVPYSPSSEEKIVCEDTLFDSVKEDGKMLWKTNIKLLRLFEHVKPATFDLLSTMVRIAPFEVYWSCRANRDLNFTDLSVEKIIPYPEKVEPYFTSQYSGLTINKHWTGAR